MVRARDRGTRCRSSHSSPGPARWSGTRCRSRGRVHWLPRQETDRSRRGRRRVSSRGARCRAPDARAPVHRSCHRFFCRPCATAAPSRQGRGRGATARTLRRDAEQTLDDDAAFAERGVDLRRVLAAGFGEVGTSATAAADDGRDLAMTWPALIRSTRSFVTPTTSATRSSVSDARTTTPLLMRSRCRSAHCRMVSLSKPVTLAVTSVLPPIGVSTAATGAAARRGPGCHTRSRVSQFFLESLDLDLELLDGRRRLIDARRSVPTAIRSSVAVRASWRSSAPAPVCASMRRTPAATPPSDVIENRPMSPVAAQWVPPHSSMLKVGIDTTRTLSPYFSPKSAIAPRGDGVGRRLDVRRSTRRVLVHVLVDEPFDARAARPS